MALSLVYITLHLNVAFIPIALFITTDDLKKAKEIESASYRMLVITTFLAWCAVSYLTISQAYSRLKEKKKEFEESLIVEVISLALVAIVTAVFTYFRNKRYKEKILQEKEN